jgi:predicted anti-sigma-YlaC factor YlaD
MTCRELVELVTDYLEGRMPFTEQLRFQFHLGMCRHCRAYLKQMKGLVEKLGALPRPLPPPPPDVQADLVQRFRDFQRSKKKH